MTAFHLRGPFYCIENSETWYSGVHLPITCTHAVTRVCPVGWNCNTVTRCMILLFELHSCVLHVLVVYLANKGRAGRAERKLSGDGGAA